jgi:hypothetical protein
MLRSAKTGAPMMAELNEAKIAHLQMIQNVIARMAGNSFH